MTETNRPNLNDALKINEQASSEVMAQILQDYVAGVDPQANGEKPLETPEIRTQNLHREWWAIQPPMVTKKTDRVKMWIFGSRSFSKLMMFKELVQPTNEQIDFWMHKPPHREEGEDFVDYKIRQKFQNALLKYRAYIYEFPKPKAYVTQEESEQPV